MKVPFWLQPDKVYVGPAWYQRDVDVPAAWAGRRLVLHLERPHWQTLAWVDDRLVGSNDSLSTPARVRPRHGARARAPPAHDPRRQPARRRRGHELAQRHRPHAGQLERHRRQDRAAGDEPGLRRGPAGVPARGTRAGGPRARPDRQRDGRAGPRHRAAGGERGRGAESRSGARRSRSPGSATAGASRRRCRSAAARGRGTSSRPFLHRLEATLETGAGRDTRAVAFGLREVATRGTQIAVNGRPTFVRGTLECAIFPKTGHPPTDVAAWRRVVRIAKAHGLNAIRFHSWCPPEAAFEAADELGFYYQVEIASWPNGSTRLGVGLPVDEWLYREAGRILRAYGSHPSFLLMAAGNEPGGPRPRVPRALRRALEGARPAPALHERVGLAADRREPVPRHARTRASRRGARACARASTRGRRRRAPTTASTSPRAACRSSATRSASGARSRTSPSARSTRAT